MSVGSPSQRSLWFNAVLRRLAVLVCAIVALAVAGVPALAQVDHTSRGPAAVKRISPIGETSGRPTPWTSRPVVERRMTKPSGGVPFRRPEAGSDTKLLNLGLIDEVSQALSLLPLWKTVGEGEPLTLSIEADLVLVSLQWYLNGQPIQGATRSVLTIESVRSANVGRYQLRATVLGITLLSVPTDVQINETDGSVDRNVAAFDKLRDSVSLLSKNSARQSSAKAGGTARGFSGTQVFSTVGATKETGEPNHCGIAGGASEWFAW